ncbi:MAG: hypothetical protein KAJ24_01770 [Candidatus Aenigmarchaeota archaeon]|nr:hypothetical protein [Candidatus Aenigmarchaeota archaeon]
MPEEKDDRAGGQILIDLFLRIWLLLPIVYVLGESQTPLFLAALGILLLLLNVTRGRSPLIGIIVLGAGLLLMVVETQLLKGIPTTIYTLANIISVDLLPLSAFSSLELAATWILWVFIALMFASADWKGCLMMLAVGGVAMNLITGLAIFAVADAEIAATYADLTDNTGIKNDTSSDLSNIWLMLSNPRLWYEREYGYNENETMAQGAQTSPYALEITKATVLEKAAPPGSPVTLDIQVTNKGKRKADLKKIKVEVENENLGIYHRYSKPDADLLNAGNSDILYLYFESTPALQAHYEFCDNPTISKSVKDDIGDFEPGMLDEYFFDVKSPECYGTQKLNTTIIYGYNVDATYNLELIDPGYYKELAMNRKLTFHTENSISSEGPLKLTIRSVPEEQPVRLRGVGENQFTVFYSISNIGPGTAVIESADKIYLEEIDSDELSLIDGECSFVTPADGEPKKYVLGGTSTPKFFLEAQDKATFTCGFGEKDDEKCITIPPNDLDKIVILTCDFKHEKASEIDTTTTLFMKMHVDYSYITTKKTQYRTTPVPDSHSCVTKRALDGQPNKTGMDLYIKEVFSEILDQKNTGSVVFETLWNADDELPSGVVDEPFTNLCPE